MPAFAYKGFNAGGKPVGGVRDADNARALRLVLKREGIFLTDLKEAEHKPGDGEKGKSGGVGALFTPAGLLDGVKGGRGANRQQVAVITRQLAVLLKAGVPLAEALGALTEQQEAEHVKRILADVRQQVNEGSSLADAMGRHPRSFEELYIHMIRAGEASGSLEAVLFRLAEFIEAQNKLRSKITTALFYPVAMGVMGAGILTLLLTTVVPKVTAIFADMGQTLPWNTRLMIFSSDLIANWWFLLFPGIFVSIVVFRRYLRTPSGMARYHKALLRFPVVGRLARMVAIARFSKTLATMLAAGVPLLRALEIVKNILGNVVLMKVVEEAKDSIKEGESIAAPLKRSREFPPIVTHMIAVGERTGELEQMLENVAESYEVEVDMAVQRLTTLLEPVMILVMGGSVAFVVFSILMPILKMNEFVS